MVLERFAFIPEEEITEIEENMYNTTATHYCSEIFKFVQ